MAENEMFRIAHNKMMALCASREYCSSDIRTKLEKLELKPEERDKILDLLVKDKFIDEQRYSKAFVKDKFRYNDWGKVKIIQQLKYKHIPGNYIKEAIEEIDGDEYLTKIKELLLAKKKSIKAKNQYDLRAKLFRYGQSKGFESELLYRMVDPDSLLDETEQEH